MSDTGEKPRAADAPGIDESVRRLADDAQSGWRAARETLQALRILVAADFSLARSALGRALACTGVAIAFGVSAWLLLMGALIAALKAAGMSWLGALLLTAALSAAVTLAAGLAAMRYFEHTRMKATRRQFARLGFGELADLMRDAGSHRSSADAASTADQAHDPASVKNDMGVDVTPP